MNNEWIEYRWLGGWKDEWMKRLMNNQWIKYKWIGKWLKDGWNMNE